MKTIVGVTASLAAVVLAGCASTTAPSPRIAAVQAALAEQAAAEGGFYVSTYPDGSGAVRLGPNYSDKGWSLDCKVDAMTDKRKCNFYGDIGGLFVGYGFSSAPETICAFGHDFPGRQAQIRVDSNAPVTTDTEGCVAASRLLAQLKSGSSVTTRRYEWPNDWGVDETSSLAGFNKAMEVVTRLRG